MKIPSYKKIFAFNTQQNVHFLRKEPWGRGWPEMRSKSVSK